MTDERPYLYLTETDKAAAALGLLPPETVIGLDTETYWDVAASHSKISLVQIAPPTGDVLVIDVLTVDIEILRPLIESPTVIMVAHNARFDERMLAGAGLLPSAFVDTLRLARIALHLPSYSLASVSAHLLGLELDKSFQKSNWRRRPLTRAQLRYAALDAQVVLEVYDELKVILAEQGKLEGAIRAAKLKSLTSRAAAPQRKRRAPVAPARPLTVVEKEIVTSLKKWRLEKSNEMRKPAYMVCADRTLEHLAMERPRTLDALLNIHGLGSARVEQFGKELLAVLHPSTGDSQDETS